MIEKMTILHQNFIWSVKDNGNSHSTIQMNKTTMDLHLKRPLDLNSKII